MWYAYNKIMKFFMYLCLALLMSAPADEVRIYCLSENVTIEEVKLPLELRFLGVTDEGVIRIEVTNMSAEPVSLMRTGNSWGDYAYRLRGTDEKGKTFELSNQHVISYMRNGPGHKILAPREQRVVELPFLEKPESIRLLRQAKEVRVLHDTIYQLPSWWVDENAYPPMRREYTEKFRTDIPEQRPLRAMASGSRECGDIVGVHTVKNDATIVEEKLPVRLSPVVTKDQVCIEARNEGAEAVQLLDDGCFDTIFAFALVVHAPDGSTRVVTNKTPTWHEYDHPAMLTLQPGETHTYEHLLWWLTEDELHAVENAVEVEAIYDTVQGDWPYQAGRPLHRMYTKKWLHIRRAENARFNGSEIGAPATRAEGT